MTHFPRAFRRLPALILASGLLVAGCGGGGDIDNQLAFRIIQAVPDAPLVNILVDGVAFRSAVDYKGGTGFTYVTPRTYRFGIEALLPGDDELILDESVPLAAGSEFTVIAVGKVADESQGSLIIQNPAEEIPDGNTRLQFVHAAPDTPPVDVYLTPAGDDLTDAELVEPLSFDLPPPGRRLVPPAAYVIRVTPAGDPGTVLYDSGPLAALRNRDDLLVMLVKNTAAGSAPVSLVINDRFSNFEALDTNTPTELRVVNLSPDAPALDVIGDPGTVTFPEVPFGSESNLAGIALDTANDRALVVDNRQGTVLAVDLASGARTLLSGASVPDAANPLLGPAGIVVDAANNRALVTDKSAAAVVAVDLATGARTLFSSDFEPDGVNSFFGPTGIVRDDANNRALVMDNGRRALIGVDLATGARTVVSASGAPDTANLFVGSNGLTLDPANGRALVVDNRLDSVLAVNLTTGARTVLSGPTTPDAVNPFTGPVGIALDADNARALVVDTRLQATLAVNLQTGARTVLSKSGTPDAVNPFSGPAAIAIDSAAGRALVVDNRQDAVVAVDLATGARSILSAGNAPAGLPFLGVTAYEEARPDNYNLRAERTAAPDSANPLFSVTAGLGIGQRTTLFATGLLATLNGQVAVDNTRPVATEGKLRLLHAGPAAGTVDVYILAPGTDIADEAPTFTNLVLTTISGHLAFEPGNYTVTFAKAGTKEVLATSPDIAAAGGTAHTVILRDEVRVDENSDGKPASVLLLDDLAG